MSTAPPAHDPHAHGHAHDDHAHDDHGHDHHGHDHHGHGHGHEHPTGWRRVLHPLTELFGVGHSHDSADSVDEALENDTAGPRALWISLAGLLLTAAVQAVVVALSGSVALLVDTLHNLGDALTAVPLLIAFRVARRPPNARFTFGYHRAEDLAGLAVLLVVAASAVLAGYQAIDRLLDPQPVTHLWAVAAAGLVGFAGNELVARYRITVGRRIGSAALVADGLHARSDGFTSLAVLLGALGVALGWEQADPVIGLVITVAILGVLRSAVRQIGARLMDAVDPALVAQARAAVASAAGVRSVDELRVRWLGHHLRAEVAITVDPDLTLVAAHDIAHHAEAHLLADVRRLTAATVHASPAGAHP
jgi:cation diffusion facilitator family transporter